LKRIIKKNRKEKDSGKKDRFSQKQQGKSLDGN